MKKHEFSDLIETMARLRGPSGCPWDKEQTFESLRSYVLEEACEVVEAIEKRRMDSLREELGDLLFEVVFQAQIAREEGLFDIHDVINGITEKLIRRHPHVFGAVDLSTADQVKEHWAQLKVKEGKPLLGSLPPSMPALLQALRVTEKAAVYGFDWEKAAQVLTKVREELGEIENAIQSGKNTDIEGEIGDALFAIVNLSRHLQIDPEGALKKTIRKFIHRFSCMAEKLSEQGKRLEEVSLEEMDRLWEIAKRELSDETEDAV
jgi:MazG family protein